MTTFIAPHSNFVAPETTSHRLNVRRALLNTLGTHASNDNLAMAMSLTWIGSDGQYYTRTVLSQGKVKSRLVANRGRDAKGKEVVVHGVNITELVYGPKKPAAKPRKLPEHLYTAFDMNVPSKGDAERIERETEDIFDSIVGDYDHDSEEEEDVFEAIREVLKDKYKKGNYRAVDLRTLLSARCGDEYIGFNPALALEATKRALIEFKIYEDRIVWAMLKDGKETAGTEPVWEKSKTGYKMKWSGRAKQARERILEANNVGIYEAKFVEEYTEG